MFSRFTSRASVILALLGGLLGVGTVGSEMFGVGAMLFYFTCIL